MNELGELLKKCCPVVNFEKEKYLLSNKIIDSMDIVNIIDAIETRYEISIEFDMITADNFDSLASINAMIERLKQRK